MKEHEEYRLKIIESRNNQRNEQNSNSMKEHLDKIRKIREDTEKSLDEKVATMMITFLNNLYAKQIIPRSP